MQLHDTQEIPRVIPGVSWSPFLQYANFEFKLLGPVELTDTPVEICKANPDRLALYVEYSSGSHLIQLSLGDSAGSSAAIKAIDSYPTLPICINSVLTPLLAAQAWSASTSTGQTASVKIWEVVSKPFGV